MNGTRNEICCFFFFDNNNITDDEIIIAVFYPLIGFYEVTCRCPQISTHPPRRPSNKIKMMISIEIELDNEKLNDYVIKINYLLFRPFYQPHWPPCGICYSI